MKIPAFLSALGLHEYESRIYLSLLETGPQNVSELSRHTGLHRPLIYRALPGLKEKGLIALSLRGKQTRYSAESPMRLEELMDRLRGTFSQALPEMLSRFETRGRRPVVRLLEGKRGITAVFEDLLNTLKRGDVFYRYSSIRDLERGEKYLPRNYRELRDRKQLERFVITNEKTGALKRKRLERAIKHVPFSSGLFEYDVTQIIYGTKVAYIDYASETAIVIEDPLIADFQVHLFKALFNRL